MITVRRAQLAALTAVTATALVVVGCQESEPQADPCRTASALPAYEVTQPDGSRVGVPAGRILVREASLEGLSGEGLSRACRAFVEQYASDHR
jgi:hypothetical protein